MGWSPQIESRLREIRMMIPEIRAVIADDEPLVRDQLRLLLAEETGVEVVAECSNAQQTIAAVKAPNQTCCCSISKCRIRMALRR